jgi:hypothetical protein
MTEIDADTIIITERLRLQLVSEKFKQVICKEFTAAITRYMPFSPSGDIKDTEAFIADTNQQFTDIQSMHLCIVEKESSEFFQYVRPAPYQYHCNRNRSMVKAVCAANGLWNRNRKSAGGFCRKKICS